ncbi:MAG: hypothetical protein WBC54_16365 [Rhodococcus sp. (in: high G+C Gram-positive bacteria)]|uniref:hypothetical protein n=1 Tax=Rhodococcus sp. SBT000017 TaxID=1803385 RepID=UPI001C7CE25E|nr:hypothetical protein [Rhodococcus sp. SBT000017]
MKTPTWFRRSLFAGLASAAVLIVSAPPASAEYTPIDYIELSTWSYDEIAPDVYEGNLFKPTQFALYIEPWSQGKELIGIGCKTTITVRGYFGIIGVNESSGRCNTSNPGTTIEVPFDGKYQITATVSLTAGTSFTATKDVLIGPASFIPAAVDTGSAAIGGPTGSSTTGSAG